MLAIILAALLHPAIIGAIAVNASTCHLPPVIVVIYADGTHRSYEKEDVTKELLDELNALPESHIATLLVPCVANVSDKPSAKPPKSRGCDETWAENNPQLWRNGHCTQIAYKTVSDSLPHRLHGLDPQGHLPFNLSDMCHGHVQEVIKQPSGGYLIVCRPAKLAK